MPHFHDLAADAEPGKTVQKQRNL